MKHLLLSLLLLLAACKREPAPEFVEFSFYAPLTLLPARDTVAVGDTLWLTAGFSDQLRDFYSGQYHSVTPANFELRTVIGFRQLLYPSKTSGDQPGATHNFTIVNKVGAVNRRSTTFNDIQYQYVQRHYNLRVGLIPRQRGVFSIFLLDGWLSRHRDEPAPDVSYLAPGTTPDGGKRHASFTSIFYGINEGNTNFHLFKQHCYAASLAYPSASNINYEQNATFTFVVR